MRGSHAITIVLALVVIAGFAFAGGCILTLLVPLPRPKVLPLTGDALFDAYAGWIWKTIGKN